MLEWRLPVELVGWITHLSHTLHGRLAWRLLPLVRGMLFAQSRRTVASWLRAAGLGTVYRSYYYLLGSLGRKVEYVASHLLRLAVWSVPKPPRAGAPKKRGPRPTYGKQALSLAKRAGHRGGWQTETFVLYREQVTKTYKTFLATYKPAGGLIRVVLVRETDGWVAFFCTDPQATVAQILAAVADRAAIEQDFHDLKEVHGTGQQQVRCYWANVAVYHLNLWLHTLIELWAWRRSQAQLCDRKESPWDDPERRPSHADRRNALRRLCVQTEIRNAGRRQPLSRRLRTLCRCLLKLVA